MKSVMPSTHLYVLKNGIYKSIAPFINEEVARENNALCENVIHLDFL